MKTQIEKLNEDTWALVYTEKRVGERENILKQIKKSDVDYLFSVITDFYLAGLKRTDDYMTYTELISGIIYDKNLCELEKVSYSVMVGAFNGGKNRAKYYFPIYYYPLLVLEHEGKIERTRKGVRIKWTKLNISKKSIPLSKW